MQDQTQVKVTETEIAPPATKDEAKDVEMNFEFLDRGSKASESDQIQEGGEDEMTEPVGEENADFGSEKDD